MIFWTFFLVYFGILIPSLDCHEVTNCAYSLVKISLKTVLVSGLNTIISESLLISSGAIK